MLAYHAANSPIITIIMGAIFRFSGRVIGSWLVGITQITAAPETIDMVDRTNMGLVRELTSSK